MLKLKGSSKYNEDESSGKNAPFITASEYNNNDKDESSRKNFPSVSAECVVKYGREHNNDEYESLRASTEISRPRPQKVPWQKELANRVSAEISRSRPQMVPWRKELANMVHFIGTIDRPVQVKHSRSGKASAWTIIRVGRVSYEGFMWFELLFLNELAETALQHLNKYDRVYISGRLGSSTAAPEDDKPHIFFKVTVMTLNFVESRFPYFSHQAVVHKNTPSLHLSEQTVVNKDPLQYKKSQVKFSTSGKNVQEDAANIESLWRAFFASPLEWWDDRTNKLNPKSPDFEHKDTGEVLWIDSGLNPLWVKSQLAVLESRMKVLEECGRGRSSARSQGSLSSSQDSGF